MKSILNIQGVKTLTRKQQSNIKAGSGESDCLNSVCCALGNIYTGSGNATVGGLLSLVCKDWNPPQE